MVCGAETIESLLTRFPNARFLEMARNIILTHHEKYDGSGYPEGLAGDQIPLGGRIVAVADIYDALTSKRVYKDAMSHEVAKRIIVDESGRHFDPAIVDAFLKTKDELSASGSAMTIAIRAWTLVYHNHYLQFSRTISNLNSKGKQPDDTKQDPNRG